MNRIRLREHIFKMLFQYEFYPAGDMPEHLRLYFDTLEDLAPEDQAYLEGKTRAILEKIPEIDRRLNARTKGWTTERMNKVDLTLLRLAAYEILWDDDIPTGVAINEAVELAKRFSGAEGPSFINGVLARFV